MLLADAVTTAQEFVHTLFLVYLLLILAYIVTSWIPLPYNVWLNRVQRFLYDVVDPYLRLFRRFLPQLRMGGLGLDLSPVLAILVLFAAERVIISGLELLH
jgi:YggT family protein